MMRRSILAVFAVASLATACSGEPPDGGCIGGSCVDASGLFDIPDVPIDRERHDVPTRDTLPPVEAGIDGGADASLDGYDVMFGDIQYDVPPDFGTFDTGVRDTGRDVPIDRPATPGCVSGATGNIAVRFSFDGSGDGSTAMVRYEANELPDTSRWLVGATTSSTSGATIADSANGGGLDLESSGAITVDLSTVGVSTIRSASIAIYGRSFSDVANGSFTWIGPFGAGDGTINSVPRITPYHWVRNDTAFTLTSPDDRLFRVQIFAGPSSSALIVDRVEICFDAI